MEVLSDLKNANVPGHILMHTKEFDGQPEAYASFFQAVSPFCGHITYSGTNISINHYMSSAITLGPPTVSKPPPPYIHLTYADALHNSKSICKPVTKVDKHCPFLPDPTPPVASIATSVANSDISDVNVQSAKARRRFSSVSNCYLCHIPFQ